MTDRRRLGLALGGVAGLALLAGAALWWPRPPQAVPAVTLLPRPVSSTPTATAPAAGTPATGTPAEVAPEPPRFDIARVGAGGATVVAGRAAPGAEVTLRDQDRELGRTRADPRGDFVILPAAPLAPGAHALSLEAQGATGPVRHGEEQVVVVVPDRPAAQAPVALLLPPPAGTAAPRVLQAAPEARLNLDIVDYDEAGAMHFAGSAPPGGLLRLYIDQRHAGDAEADAAGRWTLRPEPVPAPGRHMLRFDQLGPQGKVAARMELPFQREASGAMAAALGPGGRMVVQPGHSLWRIARATYGRGIRYTVIHQANVDQIRDPARIYPGQIFTLPSP